MKERHRKNGLSRERKEKEYVKPRLTEYGKVKEITKAKALGTTEHPWFSPVP